jgi:CO/xanthine dehydrogenase FAD-binding subunit
LLHLGVYPAADESAAASDASAAAPETLVQAASAADDSAATLETPIQDTEATDAALVQAALAADDAGSSVLVSENSAVLPEALVQAASAVMLETPTPATEGTATDSHLNFDNERLSFDAGGRRIKKALKQNGLEVSARRLDLEDSASPTLEEAAEEALRCLNCGCYAVNPSDSATALVALNAVIVTNARSISAEVFFAVRQPSGTVLEPGEIITEIRVPAPAAGQKSTFIKMAFRKSIDFSVVSCAVVLGGDSPRVCLGAVAPIPYRAVKAESIIASGPLDEERAEAAGEAAVEGAIPFEDTRYKLQIAKTLVKRALLSLK